MDTQTRRDFRKAIRGKFSQEGILLHRMHDDKILCDACLQSEAPRVIRATVFENQDRWHYLSTVRTGSTSQGLCSLCGGGVGTRPVAGRPS